MNLQPLVDELSLPEYSALSDQDAADAINAKIVSRSRIVETWEVKRQAIADGYWAAIVIASQRTDIPVEVRGLCVSAIAWLDDPKIHTIDFSLTSTQTMIGGLVLAGIATQSQADTLLALATETVPWTVANGLDTVGVGYVINARREIG